MYLKADELSPQVEGAAIEEKGKDFYETSPENKINDPIVCIDLTKDPKSQESTGTNQESPGTNKSGANSITVGQPRTTTEITTLDKTTDNYDEHMANTSTIRSPLSPTEKRSLLQMHRLWAYLPELADFTLFRKIGEGTFSSVYLACAKSDPATRLAIKHHVPTSLPARIAWELKCLREIGGVDHVGGIETAFRRNDCTVFVMPYMPHARFSDYVLDMGVAETREYLRGLLTALARVHSFRVIHRDVKPSNYLYDRASRRYMLVDFGLSCVTLEPPAGAAEAPLLMEFARRKREADAPSAAAPSKRRALTTQPNGGGALRPRQANGQPASRQGVSPGSKPANGVAASRQGASPRREGPAQDSVKKQLFGSPADSASRLASVMRGGRWAPGSANHTPPSKAGSKENGFAFPRERWASPEQRKAVLCAVADDNQAVAVTTPGSLPGNRFTALTPDPAPRGTSYVRVQDSKASSVRERGRRGNESGPAGCGCYGKSRVCTACLARPSKHVPRAGTPGFRPPEVLFKYPHQTTAVDVWAAGVVLLCVMSGCYPFFKSPNDMSALAEITVVFGSDKVKEIANKLGRQVQFSASKAPLNMRRLCEALRARGRRRDSAEGSPVCAECQQFRHPDDGCLCGPEPAPGHDDELDDSVFPAAAYQLLARLMDLNPFTRISAADALKHPFFTARPTPSPEQ